jgi:hypothetical protein
LSRAAHFASAAVVVGLALAGSSAARRVDAPPPLIGANYSHFKNENCSLDDTGIIRYYDVPGVRPRVQAQLVAMRSAGIETLRLLLWHMTEVGSHRWGVVSSSGGRLSEPERSNLIRYLRDVRSAGLVQLTVSFGPMWTNSPFGQPQYVYEPSKLEENWRFIQDVRALLKLHGPASIKLDLINEAAPSDYTPPEQQPGLRRYIAELYSRYVKAYGNEDVLVSAIAKGDPSRLANLVQILLGTGQPLPRWFEIHPSYTAAEALQDLRAADATLAASGLSQPFVVGEAAYDSRPVAQAVADFTRTSTRPVSEVIEWPLAADQPCDNISVSPPFRADAYITVLTGKPAAPPTPNPLPVRPIPTLRASVGPGQTITLRAASGARVTQLDAGSYLVVATDRSLQENFHLRGPDIDRRTGRQFRGTVRWRLQIGLAAPFGSRYSYRSDRPGSKLHGTFTIR